MARITLEAPGEDVLVGGEDITVIGTTAGGEEITIVDTDDGTNVELDASFAAGGDTINFEGEAETYTATINGSRVILTSTTGTVVSIPVGSEGVALNFGGDDVRVLQVVDGEVVIGDQTVDGETELDAGNGEGTAGLEASLLALQAAEADLAEFLDEQEVADGDELRDDRDVAQQALDDARDIESDAQLDANLSDEQDDVDEAQAAIDDVEGLQDAIDAVVAAQAEADADEEVSDEEYAELVGQAAEYGSLNDSTVEAQSQAALAALVEDEAVVFNDGFAFIVLGENGELVADASVSPTVSGTPAFAALLAEAQEAYDAAVVAAESDADLSEAQADLATADPDDLYGDLLAEQAELETAQEAIDDRDELAADAEEAQDLVDQVEALEEAVEDANVAIEDQGFERPQSVSDNSDVSATAENDIFVLNTGDGVGEATIEDFGDEGDDLLFIGSGYTVVTLEEGDDLADGSFGDASTLEVFVQQVGDDTFLYFEDEAFAGNVTTGTFQGFTVNMEDTDAADLSFDTTGYVTIEETVMA